MSAEVDAADGGAAGSGPSAAAAVHHVIDLGLLTGRLLLIYRSVMAPRGRPVERPAHLSREQRTRAQARALEWRQQCGLSQREMAAEVGVSYASYRPWENGRDDHAGPTRLQAEQLDKALRRLLRGQYI